MEITHNMVGWFEIPVTSMERAIRFYETVFNIKMSLQQFGPIEMAFFPWIERSMGSAGGLILSPGSYTPSHDGVLIYFTSFSGDVNIELSRVETAGGKVLVPKRQISPEIGYMGVFEDSEGNRIAVHNR
jgi:uncharacterized protein